MLPLFLVLSCLGQLIIAGQESETPFLQITVPQKIESNIKDAKAAEAQAHCFYQGHAAEIPASTVTLNTCSGLRGLLQLENITYGIEPLESSATFEHMIYQIKNNNIDYSPLRDNLNSQHESQSYRILVKPEFDHLGSEMGVAVQKVVHMFGLVNTVSTSAVIEMFSELKMTVMLTSLEIWSDENKIETNGDADEVLQRFLVWKQNQPSERVKVITYLLL
ncbi:disintegrin and metallopeptidase domain 3 (cyritestin) [Cricetulus griseus]